MRKEIALSFKIQCSLDIHGVCIPRLTADIENP
jgi:hypothetical protein